VRLLLTCAALGQHYEQNDAHHLALPLFLRALERCPPTSCHGVVLSESLGPARASPLTCQ
jgi:hypothetical protein